MKPPRRISPHELGPVLNLHIILRPVFYDDNHSGPPCRERHPDGLRKTQAHPGSGLENK